MHTHEKAKKNIVINLTKRQNQTEDYFRQEKLSQRVLMEWNKMFFKFPRVYMTINNMISLRLRDKWVPNKARIYISTIQFSNIFFTQASNQFPLILFKLKGVFLEYVMISDHERFPDVDSAGNLL